MFNLFKPYVRRVRQEPLPLITNSMRQDRLEWVRSADGTPMLVCSFCGGNCGQCGKTSVVGNVPFSFSKIVENLHKGGVP